MLFNTETFNNTGRIAIVEPNLQNVPKEFIIPAIEGTVHVCLSTWIEVEQLSVSCCVCVLIGVCG